MPLLVGKVMDPRLVEVFTRWRCAGGEAMGAGDPLGPLAAYRDHLVVIDEDGGHSRYVHYGRAFTVEFGQDLTGRTLDELPSTIMPPGRRGILAFEYAFARRVGKPLWRSYSARFDDGSVQTWQRLVLPAAQGRLVVAAYAVEPAPAQEDTSTAEGLLRLMISRVPAVLDDHGGVADLALTLEVFGDTQNRVEELEVLASRDPLTGVSNLRHFHHLAGLELEHARRMGRHFSLLALDIDYFKRINDTYGHAAGDSALKAFTAACRAALREPDILGRLGGEEFAVALPNTGPEGAAVIAERLRRMVEELRVPLPGGGTLSFTVSIGGVCCGGDSHPGTPDLLARADEALYAAKHEGRNRVRWG